jgi:hypothetical protein
MKYGRTASIAETMMLNATPTTTCHLYGRKYESNRFISDVS